MIIRGLGANGNVYEYSNQVTKVKIYAWEIPTGQAAATWVQLTDSNGNQIVNTEVPLLTPADNTYDARRNKLSEHMFSKPIDTTRLKIELV